jgi:hypothetical protein
LLYPLPIIFGDGERGPWYVLEHAAIAANRGDGAIPLVSSGNEEVNWLAGQISSGKERRKKAQDLVKFVGPVEHKERGTPSYIAVQGYLEGFRDSAFDLELVENLDTLTRGLDLCGGDLE